jgi:hypothetical protein
MNLLLVHRPVPRTLPRARRHPTEPDDVTRWPPYITLIRRKNQTHQASQPRRVKRQAEVWSRLRGSPCYGFQREVDDLAAVHLLASSDAEAEFGVGEVLAQQCRRLAKAGGVGVISTMGGKLKPL